MGKRILVTGAGGFIGGRLVDRLLQNSDVDLITTIDKKSFEDWYTFFPDNPAVKNIMGDLTSGKVADLATKEIDEIYHLACDMGGMGFIEENKTLCMLSVVPDTNTIRAAHKNGVKKFLFASTACVYSSIYQNEAATKGLSESMVHPFDPEDGYGWEKLFMERTCRHFNEDFGMETRVVRYHNVYGPVGTWNGGREKAPAAMCRKVIEAIENKTSEIEIWGDGEQTRSFLFVEDALDGTLKVMNSDYTRPFNVGSDYGVSINQLVDIIEEIAGVKLERKYIKGPLGVRGRNSDNTDVKKLLNWEPKISLKEGLTKTYEWIYDQYRSK